jgi:hypothetical protein
MGLLSAGQNWVQRVAAKLFGIRYVQDGGTLLVDGEQQPREYDTLNAVFPLRAVANHPEGRFDLSIEASALDPDIGTNDTVWVDPVEGDDGTGQPNQLAKMYATLPAALTAAQGLLPSATNPVLISLRPGVHDTTPLNMSASPYITIAGTDGQETAIIRTSDAASPIITGGDGVVIKNVTLQEADGAGGIGVLMAAAGQMRLEGCQIRDCSVGARSSGAGSNLSLVRCSLRREDDTQVMDVAAEGTGGGQLTVDACVIGGAPGALLDEAITADGPGTIVNVNDPLVSFASNGLYAENDGAIRCQGAQLAFCENAIHIAATDGSISAANTATISSTIEDVLVEGSGSQLLFFALGHQRPLNVVSGAAIAGTRLNVTNREFVAEGNLQVGSPGRPAGSAFGGGGITETGLFAWHNTNVEAGTWTDVTAQVTSASGSSINLVPGTAAGNSFFIGSDWPLPGVFFDIVLAGTGGTITPKYWDGAAWQPIPRWMTTNAIFPHESFSNALFGATGKRNMRFSGMTGDTAKTLAGGGGAAGSKYWYLFEVTAPLFAVPQIESARLHTDHTRLNTGGFIEYFGTEQPERVISADDPLRWSVIGVSPVTVTVNENTNLQYSAYGLVAGQTRTISTRTRIPNGLNTAEPITVEVEWDPGTSTNTGQLDLTVYYGTYRSTAIVNGGITETPVTVGTNGPGVQYQGVISTHLLDVSGALPGDALALSLQRNSGDAFTGQARIRAITLTGTFRAEGEL